MLYNVYRASYVLGPATIHRAVFIDAGSDEKGCIIQVCGDVQEGMYIDIQEDTKPEYHAGYLGKELIGKVSWIDCAKLLEICDSTSPPHVQLDLLGRKIYPSIPFYRSAEWVEDIIERLREAGILRSIEPVVPPSLTSKDVQLRF